ncbi:GNAT family N-acetyltransferase [Myxococcaceae bacterium JPH2]|nr:GNAT family N-acetyltransferase [Myxococcaceae bacterium JPH2]
MLASTVLATLRSVTPEDSPFLFALYASTRAEELAAWGWAPAQSDAFLRLQWLAQQRDWSLRFPGAEHHVVLHDGRPAGRLLVSRAEDAEAWRLVDVSLLPEHRGAGLGTHLLKSLQAEAARAGRPLHLSVRGDNPARRLYARLGFQEQPNPEPGDPYVAMRWSAPAP